LLEYFYRKQKILIILKLLAGSNKKTIKVNFQQNLMISTTWFISNQYFD